MPGHFDAEILSALARLLRQRAITPHTAEEAVAAAILLPAEREALHWMLSEALELRDRFSPGDAYYAILARRNRARVLTSDRRFAQAARGFVDVVLLES